MKRLELTDVMGDKLIVESHDDGDTAIQAFDAGDSAVSILVTKDARRLAKWLLKATEPRKTRKGCHR